MTKPLALLALAAVPALALAADMKPGSYEYRVQMEMPGMPFTPPAQTFKHCLTQAELDQGRQYSDPNNKDCQVKNLKQSAGKASFDVACKDGTTGKADYTFDGTSLSGTTVMNSGGHTMTMKMSSKRVGDC